MGSDALATPIREKLDDLRSQYEALEASLQDPEVLSDHRRVRDLSIRRSALAPVVEGYLRYRDLVQEALDLERAVEANEDEELVEMAKEELPDVLARASRELEDVKASLVNADDRRIGSIILEVRAGTGGEEAGLWARDLLEMYERFATRRRWGFELLDASSDGGMGGIRHAVASIRGEGVWIELAQEAGVHSVKRVPATESQGRIHTSTATVAVLPEPEEVEVRIDWNDVTEHITTAQGPGGQNVNKVATAVHLIHEPTGIEVRMQESKSQAQNREKARRLLLARLHEIERQRSHDERSAERRAQIGTAGRSEKIRTYRYQEGLVVDQRVESRFALRDVLEQGAMEGLVEALVEQETTRRLTAL